MAVATSTQWGELFRQSFSGFAASDIVAKTLVKINSAAGAGDLQILPVATTSDEPVGVARDDAAQSYAVTVLDGPGTLVNVVAGATVSQGQNVGINGTATEIHPVSGNVVTYPLVGPVSGASGSTVYRVGTAVQEANPNEVFLIRVNPKQLSGLS
jgi:hypothetical protein